LLPIKGLLLSGIGVVAGGLVAIQSVLNANLGQRAGNLGAVLLLTFVSTASLILLIVCFPSTASFKNLPGLSEWYLYLGGLLGVAILAAPILLVPRIGTTSTVISIILGQCILALLIDQFGMLSSPRVEISTARIMGVLLVGIGAYLVGR
jgi:bacterial/archaeal transporter family-2 protein